MVTGMSPITQLGLAVFSPMLVVVHYFLRIDDKIGAAMLRVGSMLFAWWVCVYAFYAWKLANQTPHGMQALFPMVPRETLVLIVCECMGLYGIGFIMGRDFTPEPSREDRENDTPLMFRVTAAEKTLWYPSIPYSTFSVLCG